MLDLIFCSKERITGGLCKLTLKAYWSLHSDHYSSDLIIHTRMGLSLRWLLAANCPSLLRIVLTAVSGSSPSWLRCRQKPSRSNPFLSSLNNSFYIKIHRLICSHFMRLRVYAYSVVKSPFVSLIFAFRFSQRGWGILHQWIFLFTWSWLYELFCRHGCGCFKVFKFHATELLLGSSEDHISPFNALFICGCNWLKGGRNFG